MNNFTSENPLLQWLYDSGGTRRYHNRPTLNQNVKEHSWGVAVIIMALHPNPSAALLKAAILHDAPERVYGDLLSPLKADFPEAKALDEKCSQKFWDDTWTNYRFKFPELNEEEYLWLNFADVYECCLFTREKNEEVFVYSLNKGRELWDKILSYTAS